jgi:hypothetical protein
MRKKTRFKRVNQLFKKYNNKKNDATVIDEIAVINSNNNAICFFHWITVALNIKFKINYFFKLMVEIHFQTYFQKHFL